MTIMDDDSTIDKLGFARSDVERWVRSTFGSIAMNKRERSLRFIEEAIELVQAFDDITPDEIKALVDKKYSNPRGDPYQELGGVMITLLALCARHVMNPWYAFMREFERINTSEGQAKCRAKQKIKLEEGF